MVAPILQLIGLEGHLYTDDHMKAESIKMRDQWLVKWKWRRMESLLRVAIHTGHHRLVSALLNYPSYSLHYGNDANFKDWKPKPWIYNRINDSPRNAPSLPFTNYYPWPATISVTTRAELGSDASTNNRPPLFRNLPIMNAITRGWIMHPILEYRFSNRTYTICVMMK
jgi:hypothetical protein